MTSPTHTALRLLTPLVVINIAFQSSSAPGDAPPRASSPTATRVVALTNGRWFDDTGFVARTVVYQVGDQFALERPARIDTTIDLAGRFVVPPYGEAHNHNLEFTNARRTDSVIASYLRDGVFYIQNPGTLLRSHLRLQNRINSSSSVDVSFANALLTGPGGHPLGLFTRNVGFGIFSANDSNSTGGFLWTISSVADLDQKWPAVLASHPDFIKVVLQYSEEYAKRRNDTTYFNWKGIDPALVPPIVERAHAAGLRVMAHIETAHDMHVALEAGVDEIGHMPGFRGNERGQMPDPSIFRITDADAAAAAAQRTIVVTTLGGAVQLDPNSPDSARQHLDAFNAANLTTLKKHGVRIAVGSDDYRNNSLPELFYLRSLGVFSNLELLRMMSVATPQAIFPRRQIGRLQPGYEASYLVLSGDPLTDFGSVRSIVMRVKQGQLIAP